MSKYYKLGGVDVPSVTTITGQLDKSGALTYWAANCCADYILEQLPQTDLTIEAIGSLVESARKNFRKVSEDALNVGSFVHDAIEHYLKTGNEPITKDERIISAFLAFLEWKDEHNLETISTETTLYGPCFAGTADWIGIFNGKKYVIDWKTSKGLYPEYQYQIAAYRSCNEDIDGCGVLRIDKETGLPEWKDTTKTYENDLHVFCILTKLWWATHPRKFAAFTEKRGDLWVQ